MIEIVIQDTLALYGYETALSGRVTFFLLSQDDDAYGICLRGTDTWRQLTEMIYGFQGYVSNFWDSSCVMRINGHYI